MFCHFCKLAWNVHSDLLPDICLDAAQLFLDIRVSMDCIEKILLTAKSWPLWQNLVSVMLTHLMLDEACFFITGLKSTAFLQESASGSME